MHYLKFLIYLFVYPLWGCLPIRFLSNSSYDTFYLGNCRFIGSYKFVELVREALDLIKFVDTKMFSSLGEYKIIIVESSTVPRDFFCRRFGIASSIMQEGVDSVFASIVNIYFIKRCNNFDVREFFSKTDTRALLKQEIWLKEKEELF